MKVKTRHIRIWALGLLTLFAVYYTVTTLYVHIHEVNGVVIVHSHPFTEHHSHSGGQALTLHYLSTFTSLDWHTAESVCPDFPLLYLLTFNFNAFHTLALYGEGIYLRAPPINLGSV
jgi:hypothetical protein